MERAQEVRITNQNTGKYTRLYFPCTDEELNAATGSIGIEDAVPYAAIRITNADESALKHLDGMKVNLDELNYFYKRMECLTKQQMLKVKVYADENRIMNLKDMINLSLSESQFHLLSDFTDLNKMGKQIYLDKFGGMTKNEEEGVDFIKLAEDTLQNGRTSITKHGVLVEAGAICEVYDGRLFPEYLYNSDDANLTVTVTNKAGEEQFLHLPVDICSVDKVKARLGVEHIAECSMGIWSHRLPGKLLEHFPEIKTAEDLTYLNEFCQSVKRLSDEAIMKLQMTAEVMNLREPTKLTALAKCLSSIEVYPDIHDMEQYGKQMAFEIEKIDADSAIFPFIDFKALGESLLNEQAAFFGFIEEGLVISKAAGMEIMQYHGEYAQHLECPEGELLTLRLYSPLVAAEYFKEDMGNSDTAELDGYSLTEYENAIREAVKNESCPGEAARGLMTYFHGSRELAGKVVEARPSVEVYQGELYGVLECRLKEPLNDAEYDELTEFWLGQESDGWGEGFEQRAIDFGDRELCVSFWNSGNGHFIKAESELKGTEQEQGLIIL